VPPPAGRPVPALGGEQPGPDSAPASHQAEDPAQEAAEVIALPLFDARKEAAKWW
jgi:putative transposase